MARNSSQATVNKNLVCFSIAAYAKILINHLKSSNIPVERGLTDAELASIEATFSFTFPPDLRPILQEGLPVGPGFPNWRASSAQQLNILLNLPALSLLKQVSEGSLWCPSWGPRPDRGGVNAGLEKVKALLRKAPVLVSVYRNCYIPCEPNLAGNPVFYIDSQSVRVLSFDVTGFFREFGMAHAPAWAPKEARRLEFWSDVAEGGATRRWWSGKLGGGCLDEVCRRLREGGWKEEEVREMMMMDGCGGEMECGTQVIGRWREEDVGWRVGLLSLVLLRGGWAREDVVYSLGLHDQNMIGENGVVDENVITYLEGQLCN
ncbi:hypothetical protein RchiOBHm_Chr2g0109461 [Rosa chinensis]|uniref:Knr4/Smi1-like domain-containing protein n=1 Tax=Rosa chinensis TaxID=74649 RepID=A0A2P6RPG5_ROSCH|nr:uncharacterized protein LOC112188584 [Rosa chinensis]PRQ48328.1 hypothetical protein RchiOBHm_Chr2g0109461 [Rosa chinensis]